MKKEKEIEGCPGTNGPGGDPVGIEVKPDYSNIKLHEIYIPADGDVVIEEPRLMSKFLEIARAQGESKPPQDMDMVFEVVAVGKDFKEKYKVGDKVISKGGASFPVNLVSDKHWQVWGDQLAGIVTNSEYAKIQDFFKKKRAKETVVAPVHKPTILGYDGKAMTRDIN